MKIPIQITFHDLPHSDDIELRVTEAAQKLDHVFSEITSCRVVVDLVNRRHKKGNLYTIRIDVSVPGSELYVGREPGDRNAHGDVFVAIRDAFNAMERQLQEYAKTRRGEAKRGVSASHERIAELFPDQGYGFNAFNNGSDQLSEGKEARIAGEEG